MKRNRPQDDSDDGQEEAEMVVDDEEKAERDADEDSEDEEEDDVKAPADGEEVTFLDTFYGLSSQNDRERAQAAQAMLHYCLTGPDANTKDAAYAFRRLLNGLCSGRAAARQGNASALATFLKIAASEGTLRQILEGSCNEREDEVVSDLSFLRRRLLRTTDPKQIHGRRKSSEERDYQFGRLFGILSIVRSGILAPKGKTNLEDIIENSSEFVKALAELYRYKKWMREPAAHAIGTLLNSFCEICTENNDAVKVVEHLVEHHVVRELLLQGDSTSDDNDAPLFQTYSAEQVAIAVNIQSNTHCNKTSLPAPLDCSILTKETIPLIAPALSETSVVTQPRTHLVWDTIWLFITDPDERNTEKNVDIRKARRRCPVGDDSVVDILDGLMKHVIIERLLGVEQTKSNSKGQINATHERRALALCLVRNLVGVAFVSSVAGRTKLQFEP